MSSQQFLVDPVSKRAIVVTPVAVLVLAASIIIAGFAISAALLVNHRLDPVAVREFVIVTATPQEVAASEQEISTATATVTPTETPSATATASPTTTQTPSPTNTPTATATPSPSPTNTVSSTWLTATAWTLITPTGTPTRLPEPSPTRTPTSAAPTPTQELVIGVPDLPGFEMSNPMPDEIYWTVIPGNGVMAYGCPEASCDPIGALSYFEAEYRTWPRGIAGKSWCVSVGNYVRVRIDDPRFKTPVWATWFVRGGNQLLRPDDFSLEDCPQ